MRNKNIYTPNDIFANARNEAEVDNLLNNDMYKFMMLDFILANPEYKDLQVRWKMKIRTPDVKTANIIPKQALIDQLEATKSIKWVNEAELSYLRWMNKPNSERLFREETLDYLRDFSLPDYNLSIWEDENYQLEFEWDWPSSMMWEIYWLKIINSLYMEYYSKKANLSNVEFNQVINETLHRLYQDVKILKENPDIKFSEFGTRRSLSTDYQRIVFDILSQSLPNQLIWTSNVMLSREFWWNNPNWTNAHELRMIPTALYDDPKKIIETMYDVDRKWSKHFPWLSVLLPDTYGTSFYLDNCPKDIIESHNWTRFDSKDPNIAIPEYVDFLLKNKIDPKSKIWIPSDWLNIKKVVDIFEKNKNSLWKLSFGIWTNLSNNTKWTYPRENEEFWPFGSFSVVIKPSEVKRPNWEWVSCVKLSDNPNKAFWEEKRVEFFKEVFWVKWQEKQEVEV